jgi:hypothetical protein
LTRESNSAAAERSPYALPLLLFGVATGVGHRLITATVEFFPAWNDLFMSMLFCDAQRHLSRDFFVTEAIRIDHKRDRAGNPIGRWALRS